MGLNAVRRQYGWWDQGRYYVAGGLAAAALFGTGLASGTVLSSHDNAAAAAVIAPQPTVSYPVPGPTVTVTQTAESVAAPAPTVTVTKTVAKTFTSDASGTSNVSSGAAESGASKSSAASDTASIRGVLTVINVLDRSLTDGHDPSCGPDNYKLQASNGSTIVALAAWGTGKVVDDKSDGQTLNYQCEYPYTLTVPTNVPVFELKAFYPNLEDVMTPWTATMTLGDMKTKAPTPLLDYCTCHS
jgi:hypothetical protein